MGIVETTFLFVLVIILIAVPVTLAVIFSARLIPERIRSSWRDRLEGVGPLLVVAMILLVGYAVVEAGCEGSTPSLHENDTPLFGGAAQEPGAGITDKG